MHCRVRTPFNSTGWGSSLPVFEIDFGVEKQAEAGSYGERIEKFVLERAPHQKGGCGATKPRRNIEINYPSTHQPCCVRPRLTYGHQT